MGARQQVGGLIVARVDRERSLEALRGIGVRSAAQRDAAEAERTPRLVRSRRRELAERPLRLIDAPGLEQHVAEPVARRLVGRRSLERGGGSTTPRPRRRRAPRRARRADAASPAPASPARRLARSSGPPTRSSGARCRRCRARPSARRSTARARRRRPRRGSRRPPPDRARRVPSRAAPPRRRGRRHDRASPGRLDAARGLLVVHRARPSRPASGRSAASRERDDRGQSAAGAAGADDRCATHRRAPAARSIDRMRSTATCATGCVVPSGHFTSSDSTPAASPRPKCARGSFAAQ